jgi:hypothetical protein
MSVLNPVIDYIDGATRQIFLKQGVSDYYPIEDIYHEYRNLRKVDVSLRKWKPLIRAEGNIPKGGGAFTPRYVVLLEGAKLVPFNETLQLSQLGDMITDDPDVDATLYDVSSLTVAKPIFIKPSNAETVQLNSESIVFASFLGGVWYQANSPYSDVGSETRPNGNRERPINNVQSAVEIAITRGFDTIFTVGHITLGAGDNVDGLSIVGQNPTKSVCTVLPEASTIGCEFKLLALQGTLDGGSVARECMIFTINYVNGFLLDCILAESVITLGGNANALFLRCVSGVAGVPTPIIDMGGSGQSLGMRDYNGGIRIINKTGSDFCSFDIASGKIELASTVTNGELVIRGSGKLVDESTGTTVVNAEDFLQTSILQSSIERSTYVGKDGVGVAISPLTGVDGTTWPLGTRSDPCKTETNIHTISNSVGVNNIYVMDNLVLNGDNSDGHTFYGDNPQTVNIDCSITSDVSNCRFQDAHITGQLGTLNTIFECAVGSITNANGFINSSTMEGPIVFSDSTSIEGCFISPSVNNTVVFDLNNLPITVIVSNWSAGKIEVKNMAPGSFMAMTGTGGILTTTVNNTGGTLVVNGSVAYDGINSELMDVVMDKTIVAGVVNSTIDSNVVSVASTAVTTVDDFKADASSLSADVNVVQVNGVAVTIDDFKTPSADITTMLNALAALDGLELAIDGYITGHNDTIQTDLSNLDSGLRQILTNLGDEINVNEVLITNASKSMSVRI